MPKQAAAQSDQTTNRSFGRVLQSLADDMQEMANLFNEGKPQLASELYDQIRETMDAIQWTS